MPLLDFIVKLWPRRNVYICQNNISNFNGQAGDTVIHEWAHGCGYDPDTSLSGSLSSLMFSRILTAFVMATALTSCGRIHERAGIHLRVAVETRDHGKPIQAEVHFRDRLIRSADGNVPEPFVCSTDQTGRCAAEISDNYDRNIYPWSAWISRDTKARFAFIVLTSAGAKVYAFTPTRNEITGIDIASLTFDIGELVIKRRPGSP